MGFSTLATGSIAPRVLCPLNGGFPVLEIGLADHRIRLEEDGRGDRDPECLGGLEVDDQLERRGPLDGQLARLRALQDSVHVVGRAPQGDRILNFQQ